MLFSSRRPPLNTSLVLLIASLDSSNLCINAHQVQIQFVSTPVVLNGVSSMLAPTLGMVCNGLRVPALGVQAEPCCHSR